MVHVGERIIDVDDRQGVVREEEEHLQTHRRRRRRKKSEGKEEEAVNSACFDRWQPVRLVV